MNSKVIESEYRVPRLPTDCLNKLLFTALNQNPNKTQIIDTTVDRKWTKRQVVDSALNLASYLREQLEREDVVFFITEYSDIHAIALLGVIFSGAVYSSAPVHSSEREIQELVELIKPKILISTNQNKDMIEKIASKMSIKTLLINKTENKTSIEEIFGIKGKSDGIPVTLGLDQMVTLVLSSGSTGKPKAIIRSNKNHLATTAMFSHEQMQPLTEEDALLSSGFCHICGQRSLFLAIYSSAQFVIVRNDESHEDVYEAINKFNVTAAVLIPTQLSWLIKNNYGPLPSLRDVMTGAAPLSPEIHENIEKTFNFLKFRNSYGMSESGFATLVPLSQTRQLPARDTAGKVAPGFQIKVIDQNGNALGHNQLGEICLKSDQVSPGYLNGQSIRSSDGFLRSGDLGYFDENRFFFIVSRVKDVIKVDGVSVIPAELESLLLSHPLVESAAVIGLKDDEKGEIPMAFVCLIDGKQLEEKILIDFVNKRVNDFKKLPEKGLKILARMPTTHSGKVNKRLLRKIN